MKDGDIIAVMGLNYRVMEFPHLAFHGHYGVKDQSKEGIYTNEYMTPMDYTKDSTIECYVLRADLTQDIDSYTYFSFTLMSTSGAVDHTAVVRGNTWPLYICGIYHPEGIEEAKKFYEKYSMYIDCWLMQPERQR